VLLKTRYFTLLLLFGITSSLHSYKFEEEAVYHQTQLFQWSQEVLKEYEFNINQIVKEEYALNNQEELKSYRESPSQYIEKMARTKLGKTYKWGGNGPYAYDCSGFTKEIFELNGIHIPRVSKDQAKVGLKVSKKNLKKGDLIFFNDKESSAVSHVGIYLGHGKFIHASKFHKQIVISPLREYRRFFKWGRRLI